jgi:D-3-phosphoglycerate dehydrogenase
MGLNLTESTINATTEFSELIVVELIKGGERFRLAGTIIGKSARIVEIDRLFVDTNINGKFLIVRNDDSPGIVGHVGTVLGKNSLNIANLSLARNKSEGNALNVIELDTTPSAEVIKEIAAFKGIISVTAIEI